MGKSASYRVSPVATPDDYDTLPTTPSVPPMAQPSRAFFPAQGVEQGGASHTSPSRGERSATATSTPQNHSRTRKTMVNPMTNQRRGSIGGGRKQKEKQMALDLEGGFDVTNSNNYGDEGGGSGDGSVNRSLWYFKKNHPTRVVCGRIIANVWFDRFILTVIILNSISLAMVDYSDVDADYNPVSEGSFRNSLVALLEPFFLLTFMLECVIKIIALGFTLYIKDGWNRLDFLVVAAGALELLPGVPKLSMLRTFRILRPLRSLSKFPGLKRVITAMINSLPGLMDVVLLLCFVLAIFSVLGIQFFMGILHSRCRVTPWPVLMPQDCASVEDTCWNAYIEQVVADPASYACLVDTSTGEPVPNRSSSWINKSHSPWHERQDCVWPINNDDNRVCSMYKGGWHQCPQWEGMTCGSNYDNLGNPRFINVDDPYGFPRIESGTYYEDLNWGFTNFDAFPSAILSVFQSVTMEGWSDIMYMCMDAYNPIAAAVVFVAIILLGSFIMLNLVLAVITESISEADEIARQEAESKRQARIDAGQSLTHRLQPAFPEPYPWQLPLLSLVNHPLWAKLIMGFIIANTVVLASDRYPISEQQVQRLEMANLVFTFVFAFEMVLNLLALGFKRYVADPFNNFDAVIVLFSLVELIVAATGSGGHGGGISALRAFRLFRVFKLAKRWQDLQNLLAAMQRTVMQVGNFAVLLFLFIYIYALVGLQFFSNRLHFEPETGEPISITSPEYEDADVPRANFDTFVWAMVTVFQVLTGENWNTVMYDCWRATNWVAPVYFLSLVIFGSFIVMNIFLAILLSNFDGGTSATQSVKEPSVKESQPSTTDKVNHVSSAIRFMHRLKGGRLSLNKKGRESAQSQPSTVSSGESGDDGVEPAYGFEAVDQKREGSIKPPLDARSTKPQVGDVTAEIAVEGAADDDGKNLGDKVRIGKAIPQPPLEGRNRDSESSDGSSQSFPFVQTPMKISQAGSSSARQRGSSSSIFEHAPKSLVDVARQVHHRVSLAGHTLANGLHGVENRVNTQMLVEQENSTSMWIFTNDSPVRSFCRSLVAQKKFESAILYLIMLSTIMLALDNPLHDPESLEVKILNVVNFIFSVIFAIECGLKIITYGFLLHKGSYLRNSWNQLDFFIVVVGIMGPGLKAFRTVRVLRPLRMIGRNPELKIVVDALLSSLPAILNVSVVCVLFFMVFAVMGVTYLKGTFYGCTTDSLSEDQIEYLTYPVSWAAADSIYPDVGTWLTGSSCEALLSAGSSEVPNSEVLCGCMVGSNAWLPVIPQNFNNVFSAMGALYEIATTEGWLDVMYAAIDQRGIGMQPVINNQLWWIVFFVLFMIFGSFFIMNLFVGVVIDNFNHIKSQRGAIFMTAEQEEWQKMQRLVGKIKPKRAYVKPLTHWGAACYNLMMHPRFDTFIISCILINSIVMAMPYFGQPFAYMQALEILNYTFALIFTIECIVKISAIGKLYFDEGWNRFDFIIVVGTLMGLIIKFTAGADVGTVASVIRLFRLGRILRLINSAKSLRQLFNTLITSLPSFANIGGLLFLLFFIYAVLGVQLFAKIASNDNYDAHANFRNFWVALLTLFRFSTGEAWNEFMYSMTDENNASGCVNDPPYNPDWCETNYGPACVPINGCGTWLVYPYFYSFTLVVTFIMLNLFIGVILDSFSTCQEGDDILTPQDFNIFTVDWAKFDVEGSGYMAVDDLMTFIQILDAPLGFGEDYEVGPLEVRQRVMDMHLPVQEGSRERVHFMDVANSLAKGVAQRRFGSAGFLSDHEKGRPEEAMPEEDFRRLLAFTVPDAPSSNDDQDTKNYGVLRGRLKHRVKRRSSETTPPPSAEPRLVEVTPPKRSSTLGSLEFFKGIGLGRSSAAVIPLESDQG